MKKQYTKKQITEAIAYWEKQLKIGNYKSANECDGGVAAVGDASGVSAGGDAGGSVANSNGGDNAAGITSGEVLGNCDHHKDGYLGPGCFHIPSKVKVPFSRWAGCAYGGSKRKKDKNGKSKKTPYEKGMKTVISMFEEEK